MHMHVRFSSFDGGYDVEIGLPRILRMNPALHAHFSRAPRPCLTHPALNLSEF